jgi:mono/diheme cytochrome c family protein
MTRYGKYGLLIFVLYGALAMAEDVIRIEPTRGELLYSTNCIGCHSEQVHWRDKRLVKDWDSLISEVQRWQDFSGRGWSGDDIEMVARYLNAIHYHYPAPDR